MQTRLLVSNRAGNGTGDPLRNPTAIDQLQPAKLFALEGRSPPRLMSNVDPEGV